MNGTADEKTMLNYMNRTIEPVLDAIVEAMRRTFLTRTARSQGQSVDYFMSPFKLVPLSDFAEIADKLNRNEIMTSNEIRQVVGLKPSKDPKADQLVNSNMPQAATGAAQTTDNVPPTDSGVAADGTSVDLAAQDATAAADETRLDQQMADLGIS
jgi:hypothetical protein